MKALQKFQLTVVGLKSKYRGLKEDTEEEAEAFKKTIAELEGEKGSMQT